MLDSTHNFANSRFIKEDAMTKQDQLDIIKLLSALESWSFSTGSKFPDYLGEQLVDAIEKLSKEVLK